MTAVGRALPVRTEVRRQAGRRRTQLAMGFMVLLPIIVLIAFQFDDGNSDGNGNGQYAQLASLATSGGLNFALFVLLVSSGFLLMVVVALFFGDTIASEASWGSLRYLLAAPVPRGRLLGVKLVVALASAGVGLLILTATALAAGTFRYGWHPLRPPIGEELAGASGLLRLGAVVGYLAICQLVVAGLAFLLSVSTDAPLGAVGGAVMVIIVSSILDQITALGGIRSFLPTHYGDAWIGLLSTPQQIDNVIRGCISALIYSSVCFGLSWVRFLRKDVVS